MAYQHPSSAEQAASNLAFRGGPPIITRPIVAPHNHPSSYVGAGGNAGRANAQMRGGQAGRPGEHHSAHSSSQANKPQLVQLVEHLMERQGIEYYEKNVVNQLIEFMHYYVTETVQEAKMYRDYAGKERIDVGDMRLAIAGKNYDSFTRPLPVSTVRQVAEEKNKVALPTIETMQSISEQVNQGLMMGRPSHQTQLPNTLPPSQEAHTLMAPNVHIMSEEIKAQVDDRKRQVLRLAILQMHKGQEKVADNLRRSGSKEDKAKEAAANKRIKKQKEKTKKGIKGATSLEESKNSAEKSGSKLDQFNQEQQTPTEKPAGQTPALMLGKRKADTQIAIEFDPSSITAAAAKEPEPSTKLEAKDPLMPQEPKKELFEKQGSFAAIQPGDQHRENFVKPETLDDNPFLDPLPEFNALQDNNNAVDVADLDHENPFSMDDDFLNVNSLSMAQPVGVQKHSSFQNDANLAQPPLRSFKTQIAPEQPQGSSLGNLLPSMDQQPEPELDDEDGSESNPFDEDMKDDDNKANW